jgi:hypothetical protein
MYVSVVSKSSSNSSAKSEFVTNIKIKNMIIDFLIFVL